MGIIFGYPLEQVTLSTIKTNGYGHAMTVIGFKDDVLIVGNSYGKEAGDNGVHYITREVINHAVEKYGAYTFVDISREDAEYNLNHGIKQGDNWITQLVKLIYSVIHTFVSRYVIQ